MLQDLHKHHLCVVKTLDLKEAIIRWDSYFTLEESLSAEDTLSYTSVLDSAHILFIKYIYIYIHIGCDSHTHTQRHVVILVSYTVHMLHCIALLHFTLL